MKTIPLTQGMFAMVDDEDYEFLNQYKWCVSKDRGIYYAQKAINRDGKKTTIKMHQLIIGYAKQYDIDHADGDGLNNQRYNLRVCTHMQNNANQRIPKNNKSGYKGVHWVNKRGKWRAEIKCGVIRKTIGQYSTKEEAAIAYNMAASKLFGQYARPNEVRAGG